MEIVDLVIVPKKTNHRTSTAIGARRSDNLPCSWQPVTHSRIPARVRLLRHGATAKKIAHLRRPWRVRSHSRRRCAILTNDAIALCKAAASVTRFFTVRLNWWRTFPRQDGDTHCASISGTSVGRQRAFD
jgi:hypothetical protein